MQRILKEHGIKSVQGLVDGSATPSFGAIEDEMSRSLAEDDHDEAPGPGLDVDDEDFEGEDESDHDNDDDDEIAVLRVTPRREMAVPLPQFDAPIPGVESEARRFDMARLQDLLADLIACRQLIDSALKEG